MLTIQATGCARHRQSIRPPGPTGPSLEGVTLIWPVKSPRPQITSRFGESRSGGRRHKGLDIRASKGDPVIAAASGIALFSGTAGAYGNMIILQHGAGIETAYAHLQQRKMKCNQAIKQGQEIGTVGTTGNATGPHLHFEVRRSGEAVDPLPLLPILRE